MPGGRAPLLLAAFLFASSGAFAEQTVETSYALLRFEDPAHLSDFLWRITGSRLAPGESAAARVKNRVDELVERVEALLDMYPEDFRFEIEIVGKAAAAGRPPAHYSHDSRRVVVSSSTVTDGMLAHEIAHAVICAHFSPPPPHKAQEILARYVDENLWSEA